jgi:hypothetical protein
MSTTGLSFDFISAGVADDAAWFERGRGLVPYRVRASAPEEFPDVPAGRAVLVTQVGRGPRATLIRYVFPFGFERTTP